MINRLRAKINCEQVNFSSNDQAIRVTLFYFQLLSYPFNNLYYDQITKLHLSIETKNMNFTQIKQELQKIKRKCFLQRLAGVCQQVFNLLLADNYHQKQYLKHQQNNSTRIHQSLSCQNYKIMEKLRNKMLASQKMYIPLQDLLNVQLIRQAFNNQLQIGWSSTKSNSQKQQQVGLLRKAILGYSKKLWVNYHQVRPSNIITIYQNSKKNSMRRIKIMLIDVIDFNMDEQTLLTILRLRKQRNQQLIQQRHQENKKWIQQNFQVQFLQQYTISDSEQDQQQQNQLDHKNDDIIKQIKYTSAWLYYNQPISQNNYNIIDQITKYLLQFRPNIELNHKLRLLTEQQHNKHIYLNHKIKDSELLYQINPCISHHGIHNLVNFNKYCPQNILKSDNSLFFDHAI